MSKWHINTPADYGDTIVNSDFLAYQRGSGQYNPPPLFEQTTNRGKDYTHALNYYEQNYHPVQDDNKLLSEKYKIPHKEYYVGVSGLYTQNESWSRPDPEGVGNQYVEWAMKSVQENPSVLLNFYFSIDNIQYILKRISEEVKNIRGVDIAPQSQDELLIIMRNHYQRALSGWLPHQDSHGQITNENEVYPRGETPCSLETRLSRLNSATIEECVKQVLSGVDMYMQYYKDASSLPLPLERPRYVSEKGSRVLSENVGFNSGHDFTNAVNSYNQRFNIL